MLANVAQCLFPDRLKILLKSDLRGVRETLLERFTKEILGRDQANIGLVNAATLEAKSRNDILFYNVPHYLHYEDRNSMAFSIEQRVPFLDHRLVEWSQELPICWKIRNGQSKYVLRRALKGLLPHQVIERKEPRLCVYQGDHPGGFLAHGERHTQRRFGAGCIGGIIRAAQPALILAGIRDQNGLPVTHHPPGQSLFEGGAQLLRGFFNEMMLVYDRRFNRFPAGIQHNQAATDGSDIAHREQQNALEYGG